MTDEPQTQPDANLPDDDIDASELDDETWPPSPGQYTPPVSKLLTYGQPTTTQEWPNYRELGLRKEHIPDLIRMATDEGLYEFQEVTDAIWAPTHAWRTLGQLHATEAIQPLLDEVFWRVEDGDEWVAEEMPVVFSLFGPKAIPYLSDFLDADKLNGSEPRAVAVDCLLAIGQYWDYAIYLAAQVLIKQLKDHARHHENTNSILIMGLMSIIDVLPYQETIPVMSEVIQSGRVPKNFAKEWDRSMRQLRQMIAKDPEIDEEERKELLALFR